MSYIAAIPYIWKIKFILLTVFFFIFLSSPPVFCRKMLCPRYFCNNTLPEYECISDYYQHLTTNSSFIHYNVKTYPDKYKCDISTLEKLDLPATCKQIKEKEKSNLLLLENIEG